MTDSATLDTNGLTPQQKIVRRKLSEDMAKILNRRPTSAQDYFAHIMATQADWTIAEQPARTLPFALCQLISLKQRDIGNSLLEETRELNNQQIGCSFRTVKVRLNSDPHLLDLKSRTLAWGDEVAEQVNFKLRHQARNDPYQTFFNAYDSIVAPIDQVIVYGNERLNSLVWETIVDLLPCRMLDAMLFKPGHCKLSHDATAAHLPDVSLVRALPSQRDRDRLQTILSLYSEESLRYIEGVVLTPLLAALRDDPAVPGPEALHQQYQQMFADLLEAYPYLLSSDRAERYMFSIPGTTCVATFSFLAPNGCGRVVICDDVASLRRGLHTNFVRSALRIDYDGEFTSWTHPWLALDTMFGAEGASRIAWWLLKQVHSKLVDDYLSIKHYYLEATDLPPAELEQGGEPPDETLLCVALAQASETEEDRNDGVAVVSSGSVDADGGSAVGRLPQLRRRYFFKLLERCGVEIAQGKGSEIKLLRKAKRPFRLGNHYGVNPTIPAFLAADILKRLEITGNEWMDAIAAR